MTNIDILKHCDVIFSTAKQWNNLLNTQLSQYMKDFALMVFDDLHLME